MSILIRNGTVVNEDEMRRADVLVRDGKIVSIEDNIECEVDRTVNAVGRYVIPGGIDPHTHLQLPFRGEVSVDDFHQGTNAAVAGGTTMIIDFVIPEKDSTLLKAYRKWRDWADPKVVCDYALTMAVTSWNEEISKEMGIVTGPEYGINSFKFYLAYEGLLMVNDGEFYQGMMRCVEVGALARVHAENGPVSAETAKKLLSMGVTGPEGHAQSRPEELEAEATNRACVLAGLVNCPLYVVHVMSKGAARVIVNHRQKGLIVFGEPIAAGLGTDGSHYCSEDWIHAAQHVMSPPLSMDKSTPEALMHLLASGDLHLVGTDNATFSCRQKAAGRRDFTKIPSGLNGLEDRMSVVWEKGVHSGAMDPMRFVAVTSSTCAKIFNIYPRKGRIAVGSDADIVVWNPDATRVISKDTHHQAIDFNVFEGQEVHGVTEITIVHGKIVYENGVLSTEPGSGRFVSLPPYSPYVFSSVQQRAKVLRPRAVRRDAIQGAREATIGDQRSLKSSKQPPGGVSNISF